ncbi:hypothetical protein TTHERM_00449560 (macronuclear) [Tetrahymena thermophila SB210]|uniref:Uncharacterized protein n=1 Tax=Tetrahymena thermophila (strain SB210) TaxID=312017 RepID=Q238W4_TETTS|nr:hypothetical protein TTHERM_00449560 [Tetrahymena thermophila SB210]EAR93106.2 hypothetical protein TTHERM_00449560 [Tetrahymena thermophila SB210]|eukprot:XP_001013351.2 hypothetical protein TTHERM_00449560 [Tetrahymena thermophila SB210]
MDQFSISSNKEDSYNGTFSNNSKQNYHQQKEILRSNNPSVKNIEAVSSTSKFDAQMLQNEIQNIRQNQIAQESQNFNSQFIENKEDENFEYELNDLTDKDDISHQNCYEDLLGFKNNHKVYDFNSPEISSDNLKKQDKKNTADNIGTSSFMHQSFSSQINNIVFQSSNNNNNQQLLSQNGKQIQQYQQQSLIDGNFSLNQNNDMTQDEMLLDNNEYEAQDQDDQEGFEDQETSVKFRKQQNKFQKIKTQSEQQLCQQQQRMNNQRLSDSNPLLPLHDHSNVKNKQGNQSSSQNFKLFNQNQNVKKNNYLTSEESNTGLINNYNPKNNQSQELKNQFNRINNQEDQYYKSSSEQNKDFLIKQRKGEIEGDDEEEEDDGIVSSMSAINVQFVTLQNDLGDSTQKKTDLKQYFHMNNSIQNSLQGGSKEDFLFNNQSAHFSTMNPQYLESCQNQYNIQMYQKHSNNNNNSNNNNQQPQMQNLISDGDREQKYEQNIDSDSAPYTPYRLYNIQQTTEQTNRSSARVVEQTIDSNQKNIQEKLKQNQMIQNQHNSLNAVKDFPDRQQNKKNKLKNEMCIGFVENNEINYKTIDVNEQKNNSSENLNQNIMQKLYKKNQELTQNNKKLVQENQMLKQELENMKTDLLKKYEEIRKNNESLFKNFEEQSNLMLKKQKEKYEEKLQKLQLSLREQETQNLYKKDNFRDRNNQLYAMVLKLEREKQELNDKNLILIKKQINAKSENHKNTLNMISYTNNPDQSELDINNKSNLSQLSLPYRKLKMGNDDSTLNLENQQTLNNQNSFCQGIISPSSFSSRQNQKSKSIDIVRKNMQFNSAANINEKISQNNYNNQTETQYQDFKVQAEKHILEKKYDDLFSKYKRLLDENHELRKNQLLSQNEKEIDKSLDQQTSIISPSITTAEARLSNYLNQQQANSHYQSNQSCNQNSQQTNNVSTQCASNYYQLPPSRDQILSKPYSKIISDNSNNNSIMNKERSNSYYLNKRTINFKPSQNTIQMYDPLNFSTQDEYETVNQSKADSSTANILLYHNYKTQDSTDSPQRALKKKSIHLSYYNPKYFSNNEQVKESLTNYNSNDNNNEQLSDQNPCSLVRMNNYVLSRKYVEETKQKKKSVSKNKESKKKKQSLDKSNLDISGIREKNNKQVAIHDDKENNASHNIVKNSTNQDKAKKLRSNSLAKTPVASTKTTINHDKDTSLIEGNKLSKKNQANKKEIKRSSSNNNKGCKTPIFSKIRF